jgi:hypothetical protein
MWYFGRLFLDWSSIAWSATVRLVIPNVWLSDCGTGDKIPKLCGVKQVRIEPLCMFEPLPYHDSLTVMFRRRWVAVTKRTKGHSTPGNLEHYAHCQVDNHCRQLHVHKYKGPSWWTCSASDWRNKKEETRYVNLHETSMKVFVWATCVADKLLTKRSKFASH